jgi:hypothetical protein
MIYPYGLISDVTNPRSTGAPAARATKIVRRFIQALDRHGAYLDATYQDCDKSEISLDQLSSVVPCRTPASCWSAAEWPSA